MCQHKEAHVATHSEMCQLLPTSPFLNFFFGIYAANRQAKHQKGRKCWCRAKANEKELLKVKREAAEHKTHLTGSERLQHAEGGEVCKLTEGK